MTVARAKILLVDDEQDIIETLQWVLEKEGFEIITAANGLEALGAVRLYRPHLVLLDVMLPRENGYRVSRVIKQDVAAGVYDRPIHVVLVTARDLSLDPNRERMFMDFCQADEVVYKPFDLDTLLNLVDRCTADATP
jgi:CheY-like chemotaxis protein